MVENNNLNNGMNDNNFIELQKLMFLITQELACEVIYAPHYLKFEDALIYPN